MTQREREIYEIIRKNPLLSQKEIAEQAGVSRSAVSVYLDGLYKQNVLLGRGYILNEPSYPVVIGPGHVDISSTTNRTFAEDMYRSSKTQMHYGGPAKNVVDQLIAFSVSPKAIFVVGNDELGRSFLNACEKKGIAPENSIVLEKAATSVYMELMDEEQNIIFSSYSEPVMSAGVTPAHIMAQKAMLLHAEQIILHDSLPTSVSLFLKDAYPDCPLVLIGSSSKHIARYRQNIGDFAMGIMSLKQAHVLTDQPTETDDIQDTSTEHLADTARRLAGKGLRRFCIMADQDTLLGCDGKAVKILISPCPRNPRSNGFVHFAYSDCRDIFTSLACWHMLMDSGLDQLLPKLAAARNIVTTASVEKRFEIPMQEIEREADALRDVSIQQTAL